MIETLPSGTQLRGRNNRVYRIERVLGSGGFGHVYLAVDMESNLQCAVKEYLITGETGRKQLEHEANVLSRLRHPNLPAYQDYFSNERGRYYIVLSYIDGNDLTDQIRMVRQKNSFIPLTQILNWLLAICDAVRFLHEQQPPLIHRDIKPDNIRITPAGTAVLVDLGNAKEERDGARTLFFIRHQGTPGYAPPEQYPGGLGTDARSDIYALGATLFFALTTLEPPTVQVRNQSSQPTPASLQEHLRNNPPEESLAAIEAQPFRLGISAPSRPAPRHSRHIAQLGTLPPQLLIQLNAIIQKSMALSPKNRYQLVTDFAHDLRQVAMALSPSPTPPTPPVRPVDPNATQPDSSGFYDQLQGAKEKKNQAARDASAGIQPASQPNVAALACPNCRMPLAPQAVFCPNCGTPLGKQTHQSSANPQAQMQNAPFRNSAPDKTQLAPSNIQEAIALPNATVQAGGKMPGFSPYNPAQPQQAQWPQRPPTQANSMQSPQAMGPRGQNHGSQPIQQTKQQPSFIDSLFSQRVIIATIVLIAILLTIFVFLITHH
jgi:serine/threonine protein kinase